MDPNACLRRIEDALAEGDESEANAAANDLRQWIERGGFEPDWDRYQVSRRSIMG